MNFGEVFVNAWKIIWKYKFLWLFGLLSSFGQSDIEGTIFDRDMISNWLSLLVNLPIKQGAHILNFLTFFEAAPSEGVFSFLIRIAPVLLAFLVINTVINTYGDIGIIQSAVIADTEQETLLFNGLLSANRRYYWRALGLNLIVLFISIGIALFLLGYAVISSNTDIIYSLQSSIMFFCFIAPVLIFILIVFKQSFIALIVEDLSIRAAFERGWEILLDNLGPIFGMALILSIGAYLFIFVHGILLANFVDVPRRCKGLCEC